MFGGLIRDCDTGHLAELPRPHPACVDHVLGLDVVVPHVHPGDTAVLLADLGHRRLLKDPGALRPQFGRNTSREYTNQHTKAS